MYVRTHVATYVGGGVDGDGDDDDGTAVWQRSLLLGRLPDSGTRKRRESSEGDRAAEREN